MASMLDVFATILKKLNEQHIDYMIVGSIAAMIYGEPRLTQDMDIVIHVNPSLGPKLTEIFPEANYYLPPSSILAETFAKKGQFNLIDYASALKVDFVIRRSDAHSILEFERKRNVEILPGLLAWVASPEDVIIKKLIYFREGGSHKHISDIRSILGSTKTDAAYLDLWINTLSLQSEWKTANS